MIQLSGNCREILFKNRLEFSRFSTYNAACSILIYIILKGLFGPSMNIASLDIHSSLIAVITEKGIRRIFQGTISLKEIAAGTCQI